MDIRKYGIVIAVTILSAFLIHAIATAVAGPAPQYPDCWSGRMDVSSGVPVKAYPPSGEVVCTPPPLDVAARDTCVRDHGSYVGITGTNGCVMSYECSTCQKDYDALLQQNRLTYFYAAIIAGVLLIIGGFMLPLGSIHEWVGLGFIFGGVIGMFIGTVAYWSDLGRWLKPLLLAVELVIVLAIIYKRMQDMRPDASASASTSTATEKAPRVRRKR